MGTVDAYGWGCGGACIQAVPCQTFLSSSPVQVVYRFTQRSVCCTKGWNKVDDGQAQRPYYIDNSKMGGRGRRFLEIEFSVSDPGDRGSEGKDEK